jgi:hypothetical protein
MSMTVVFLDRNCEPRSGSGVPCTAISGRTIIVGRFEVLLNVFTKYSGKSDVGSANCLDGICDQLGPNGNPSSSIMDFPKVRVSSEIMSVSSGNRGDILRTTMLELFYLDELQCNCLEQLKRGTSPYICYASVVKLILSPAAHA